MTTSITDVEEVSVRETLRRCTRRTIAPLLLTAGLLGAAACGSDASPTEAAVSLHHTDHTAARANEIVMKLIAYQPDELTVPADTKVTWNQTDAGFHTVTSGTVERDPSGSVEEHADGTFTSGQLAKDETFAFTFDENGTYPYFCEIHPATMRGRVTVA